MFPSFVTAFPVRRAGHAGVITFRRGLPLQQYQASRSRKTFYATIDASQSAPQRNYRGSKQPRHGYERKHEGYGGVRSDGRSIKRTPVKRWDTDDSGDFRREWDDVDTRGSSRPEGRSYGRNRARSWDTEDSRDFRRGWDDDKSFRSDRRFRRSERFEQGRDNSQRWPEDSSRRKPDSAVSPETRLIRAALDSEDDFLFGINPVLFSLQQVRRSHVQLYVQEKGMGSAKKPENQISFEKIMTLATVNNIPTQKVSRGSLNVLSGNRPHQGVVLQTGVRDFAELKSLPFNGEETWLVLDEITDPQNAGALVRSSYFLGATGVIVCKRNSSSLTAVMSKASAGAMELMDIHGVQSMPRFLKDAREQGWRIIGMGLGQHSVSCKDVKGGGGVLIVLGSEGRGLRKMVKDCCDTLVKIEGGGEGVDSLNVSVAGGVALYQLISK